MPLKQSSVNNGQGFESESTLSVHTDLGSQASGSAGPEACDLVLTFPFFANHDSVVH